MRTKPRIDSYQAGYFVVESFDLVFEATAPDFLTVHRAVRDQIAGAGEVDSGIVLPGERVFS
jgi:phenylalanine-4-hydroxylase